MAESDPLRNPPPRTSDRLDRETLRRLRRYASHPGDDITHDLRHLDEEWDVERAVTVSGAALGLLGLALGIGRDRRWLVVPGVMLSCLAMNALGSWRPSAPLLRVLGFRTRREVERERYAMKGMRGDFDGAARRSQAAWRAVRD